MAASTTGCASSPPRPSTCRAARADTQKKLEELFDDLSDDDVESGGTITVNHRKIKVVRESENVIWFEFAALCEGPRSPADYVAIASEYQSVMIANVPVFDDTRRQRRAALHLGDRRVLRPRRQRDPVRRRGARGAVSRARSSSSSFSAPRAG